jgi:hypothetical protein
MTKQSNSPTWNPTTKHYALPPFIYQVGNAPNYTWTVASTQPPYVPDPNGGASPNVNFGLNQTFASDGTLWCAIDAEFAPGAVQTTILIRYTEEGHVLQGVLTPGFFGHGGGPPGGQLFFDIIGLAMFGSNPFVLSTCRPVGVGGTLPNSPCIVDHLGDYTGIDPSTGVIYDTNRFDFHLGTMTAPFGDLVVSKINGMWDVGQSGFPGYTVSTHSNIVSPVCADASGNVYTTDTPGGGDPVKIVKINQSGQVAWSVSVPQTIDPQTQQPLVGGVGGIVWNSGRLYMKQIVTDPTTLRVTFYSRFALRDSDGNVVASDTDDLRDNPQFAGKFFESIGTNPPAMQAWNGTPSTWGV